MAQFENYQILNTLGQGSFGKVKLAQLNGVYYAIKFSTTNKAYSQQTLQKIFKKQSLILRELDHPYIIKLHQIITQGSYIKESVSSCRDALVFQYAPYNLGQILELGSLQQVISRTIFHQLIEGISYLHEKNIIHRDIKPNNILFADNYWVKICDFGLSTKIDQDTKPKTICGSDSFKSPEMLMKKNYNGVMNDLFAAAVTLFILVTGKQPFNNATPNAGLYQFIALNYNDKFWKTHDKTDKISPSFKSLMNSMLSFDPTHRLSISQILSHPWMTEQTLMGEDLTLKMKQKELQLLQKKRKLAYKTLRMRGPNICTKKVKRSSSLALPQQIHQIRTSYTPKLHKLSDRLIPQLSKVSQLQSLFDRMDIKLSFNKQTKRLEILRIYKQELIQIDGDWEKQQEDDQRLRIAVWVEAIDQETDCLKFQLLQGHLGYYTRFLQQFDQNILNHQE